jgi:hypothetical protein
MVRFRAQIGTRITKLDRYAEPVSVPGADLDLGLAYAAKQSGNVFRKSIVEPSGEPLL